MQTILLIGLSMALLGQTLAEYALYDIFSEVCCEGTVYAAPDVAGCCGSTPYNLKEQICCNGTVFGFPESEFGTKQYLQCCSEENTQRQMSVAYNPMNQICCNGKVIDQLNRPGEAIPMCCGDSTYNLLDEICCNGNVLPKFPGPDKTTAQACCGDLMYNPRENNCCGGNLVDPNFACCGSETYDTKTEFCCSSNEISADGVMESASNKREIQTGQMLQCCGPKPFDPKSETCCTKIVRTEYGLYKEYHVSAVANPAGVQYVQCCGKEPLMDYRTQICCNETVFDRKHGIYTSCCVNELYNSFTHTCCNNTVFVKEEENRCKACCLGTGQMYDPYSQTCCGDTLMDLTDDDMDKGRTVCCAPDQSSFQSYVQRSSINRG